MKKNNLNFILFYSFLGISLVIGYSYLDSTFGNTTIDIIQKPISNFHQEKIVDVERNIIYNLMTDVENFPIIIPKNILSVIIFEQNNNIVIGEIEVIERGIKSKINFQQTLFPYEKQTIEIIDGDAKGTMISQKFIIENSETKINFILEPLIVLYSKLEEMKFPESEID